MPLHVHVLATWAAQSAAIMVLYVPVRMLECHSVEHLAYTGELARHFADAFAVDVDHHLHDEWPYLRSGVAVGRSIPGQSMQLEWSTDPMSHLREARLFAAGTSIVTGGSAFRHTIYRVLALPLGRCAPLGTAVPQVCVRV